MLVVCAAVLVPPIVAGAQTPPNEPPSFGSTTADRSIAENSETGAAIGEPVAATDDTDTSLTYSLEGSDAVSFSIDGSGQLSVGDDVQLDYETKTQHSVTVRAADSEGASATIDVAITVTDVNDPSIILIMADDAGYEVFGAYGTTQYSTPELDAIAAAGARFTNMFALPACPPSRVALMTGKSNVRNYVDWGTLRKGEYTFADLFSDAGYATAVGGKWQLQQHSRAVRGTPGGTGFDTHCLWQTRVTYPHGSPYWNPRIACSGALIDTDADDYGPDIFTDFHLDFIEANRDRPFFAYYPMVLPHAPHVLPPGAECADADDTQCIFEKMIAHADHNVGRIHDKLKSLGLLDNTILMFTADNGTSGKFATSLDGRTLRGGKGTTLDAGTRVPLIAWVPGQPGGRALDDLIHIADIFPTLADAAGIEIPDRDELDGVSFWEQLRGNAGTPRETLFMYYFPSPYLSRFNNAFRHPPTLFVRDARYKLYRPNEMYDLSVDPHEIHPLPLDHEESASARTKLRNALSDVPWAGQAITWEYVSADQQVPRPRRRPVLSGASMDRSNMTLSYVGQLAVDSQPAPGDFLVSVDGSEVAVSSVSVGDRAVTLTLASRVWEGQTVAVSYTPGSAPLRRHNDQPADAVVDEPVLNLTPPNRPPGVGGPAEVTVAENSDAVVATFSATDDDGDAIAWSLAGDDASLFEVTEGALSFRAPPDFDDPADLNTDNRYEVTVNASDGMASARQDVAVTVVDVNEPPDIVGEAAPRITENRTGVVASYDDRDPEEAAIAWSLSGADAADFRIDGGRVSFASTPDFENPVDSNRDNIYLISVRAYDGAHTDEFDVAVTVSDADEPGTLTVSSPQPQVGTALAATLDDPDNAQSTAWSWQRSTDQFAWTTVDAATSSTYIPVDDDVNNYLRMTATYDDRHGTGKALNIVSSAAVRPAPVTNKAPRFPTDEIGRRTVPENSPAPWPVGAAVAAEDDDGDDLRYSLVGTDAASFSIDGNTGQLWTEFSLDFEAKRSYIVTITASDPSLETDTISVTINVENEDEEATLVLSASQPQVGATLTATLADLDGRLSNQAWRWERSADGATNWTPIAHATGSRYTPTDADAYLRVRVTYTDGHGPGKLAQAAAQHAVRRANEPAPGGGGGGAGGGGGGGGAGGGGGGGGGDQEPEPVPSAGFADVAPTNRPRTQHRRRPRSQHHPRLLTDPQPILPQPTRHPRPNGHLPHTSPQPGTTRPAPKLHRHRPRGAQSPRGRQHRRRPRSQHHPRLLTDPQPILPQPTRHPRPNGHLPHTSPQPGTTRPAPKLHRHRPHQCPRTQHRRRPRSQHHPRLLTDPQPILPQPTRHPRPNGHLPHTSPQPEPPRTKLHRHRPDQCPASQPA